MMLCSRQAGDTVRGMIGIRIPACNMSTDMNDRGRIQHTSAVYLADPRLGAAQQGERIPAGHAD